MRRTRMRTSPTRVYGHQGDGKHGGFACRESRCGSGGRQSARGGPALGGTVGVRRHSGPPVPITGIGRKDRLASGNRLRTKRGGRMPTGVTRGTLSFYLRVSPPRFPARTRAVCSFGAPRMEALQRLVGQQSFRLKDSLRRRPMPFAAGWGLSCCRHPKPSVNGGVSGWRGKRKRHRNTPEYLKKYTVCAHNITWFRTGLRQRRRPCPQEPPQGNPAMTKSLHPGMPPWTRNGRETPRPTPAPGGARPAAGPSAPQGR